MRYQLVCVAGTFAGLHAGHEAVLEKAFREGERVIIGLTTGLFVERYKNNIKYTDKISNDTKQAQITSYEERKRKLERWLKEKGWGGRATIVAIDDPWEPVASDPEAEALIVTLQNKARGEEINDKRKHRGLKSLALIEVPLVMGEDGQPISSTRVRNGEIDGNGKLIMPESLRNTLAQPLGKVLVGEAIDHSFEEHRGKIIVAVGDVATKALLEAGVTPALMIIDGKVGRQPYHGLDQILKEKVERSETPHQPGSKPWLGARVVSGPGYISQSALEAIRQWASQLLPLKVEPLKGERTVIEVEGEEDLLTLPAVVEAPLGAVVYYGQPARRLGLRSHSGEGGSLGEGGPAIPAWACGLEMQGLVEVVVTEGKKQEASELLAQFT